MATGAPFVHGVPISASELNQKTVTYTDDVTLETTMPGQIFYCKANSGSFYKDDVISRKIDDDGFSLISQNKHLHNEDTNRAGGLLSDVFAANLANMAWFYKPLGFGGSDVHTYGPVGATIGMDLATGACKWDTGTTVGDYLVSKIMGTSPSLTTSMTLKSVMQFHGNITNIFVRWGVNMEPMDVSNNNDAKFGIESCAASNGNWNVVSAEGGVGSARTTMDANASLEGSTTVGPTASRRGHVIKHVPGSYILYKYHNNLTVSKSTNLPSQLMPAGYITPDQATTIGIKTTDTNSKQLYIWGMAIIGGLSDTAWNISL